jgi:periplasmic divalent cation tolerance protein
MEGEAIMAQPEHVVVFITAPSKDVGRKVAEGLLERKLAACINIVASVNSLYNWQGKPADDEECLLIVKTRAAVFEDRFVPAVKNLHPYEVPEIIALPIVMGSKSYLDWIDAETTD